MYFAFWGAKLRIFFDIEMPAAKNYAKKECLPKPSGYSAEAQWMFRRNPVDVPSKPSGCSAEAR